MTLQLPCIFLPVVLIYTESCRIRIENSSALKSTDVDMFVAPGSVREKIATEYKFVRLFEVNFEDLEPPVKAEELETAPDPTRWRHKDVLSITSLKGGRLELVVHESFCPSLQDTFGKKVDPDYIPRVDSSDFGKRAEHMNKFAWLWAAAFYLLFVAQGKVDLPMNLAWSMTEDACSHAAAGYFDFVRREGIVGLPSNCIVYLPLDLAKGRQRQILVKALRSVLNYGELRSTLGDFAWVGRCGFGSKL